MASSPYSPTSFNPDEPISDDKMNQIANNVQWLYENSPRMLYNAHGTKKGSGIKILSGMSIVPTSASTLSTVTVYFGSFFSQGCRPVVVATPNGRGGRTRYMSTVKGIGYDYPDHRGAELQLTTDEYAAASNKHLIAITVHWIAVGW